MIAAFENDEFTNGVNGAFTEDWRSIIPAKESFFTSATATRKSATLVCRPPAAKLRNMMVATADITPSVNMIWKDKVDFQHVSILQRAPVTFLADRF